MGQAKSIHGYPDCREFMQRALNADKGWWATFPTAEHAAAFRRRCYTARSREAVANSRLYDEDSPLHGTSVYHRLVITIQPSEADFRVIAVHGEAAIDTIALEQGAVE